MTVEPVTLLQPQAVFTRCFDSTNWDPRGLYSLSLSLYLAPFLYFHLFNHLTLLLSVSIRSSRWLSLSFHRCLSFYLSALSSLCFFSWQSAYIWIGFCVFTGDDKLWHGTEIFRQEINLGNKNTVLYLALNVKCVQAQQPAVSLNKQTPALGSKCHLSFFLGTQRLI